LAKQFFRQAFEGTEQKTAKIDAIYLKAHRTASSLRAKEGPEGQLGRSIRCTKGRLNHNLHAKQIIFAANGIIELQFIPNFLPFVARVQRLWTSCAVA
jgi:hypothetical protein